MAKKPKTSAADDLLAGGPAGGDDLLGGSAPAGKKVAAKKAPAKTAEKTAEKPAEKPATPAAKKAAPAAKKAAPAAERAVGVRGEGKFYMNPDEKTALAKKIGASKKPASTKDLAEKFEVATWQVRRAINEILVPDGKGSVEKVGNVLTYTPA